MRDCYGKLTERGDLVWRRDGRDKRTEEGGSDAELRGREKASFTFPGKAESGQAGCRPGGRDGHTGCGGSESRVRAPQRCVDSVASRGAQHPGGEAFARAPSSLEGGRRLGIYYVPSLVGGRAEGLPGQE